MPFWTRSNLCQARQCGAFQVRQRTAFPRHIDTDALNQKLDCSSDSATRHARSLLHSCPRHGADPTDSITVAPKNFVGIAHAESNHEGYIAVKRRYQEAQVPTDTMTSALVWWLHNTMLSCGEASCRSFLLFHQTYFFIHKRYPTIRKQV
jgi:hypothetical protein